MSRRGSAESRPSTASPSPRATKRTRRETSSPQAGPSTQRSPKRPRSSSPSDGDESDSDSDGGSTSGSGDWVYQLEIVQQPQRARACGFGDKDRRPLSPPPIIRLWVRTPSGELVDVSHINTHFLILMVDLWSSDHETSRNIVMHPSQQPSRDLSPRQTLFYQSDDRPGSASRPTTGSSRTYGQGTSFSNRSGPAHSPGISPNTFHFGPPEIMSHLPVPDWPSGSGGGPSRPPMPRVHSFGGKDPSVVVPPTRPFTAPSARPPPLARQIGMSSSQVRPGLGMNLPPLTTLTERPASASARITLPSLRGSENLPSRKTSRPDTSSTYDPSSGVPPLDFASARPSTSSGYTRSSVSSAGAVPRSPTTFIDFRSSDPHFPPYPENPGSSRPSSSYKPDSLPISSDPYLSYQQDSSFSRVLVGSLCSVCQKMQDENGQWGLFFFAHDLGVRTEGIFSLRFSLANLLNVMPGVEQTAANSSVLAEIYSNPFQVYSAKKFPGVIPTTELTRVFARQGVRLPTRQRRTGNTSAAEGESGDEDE